MKQAGILRYQTDLLVQRVLGGVQNILTVDQYLPALRFEMAQDQVDEGGFAGTGETDQADALARFDGQIQALKHRRPGS